MWKSEGGAETLSGMQDRNRGLGEGLHVSIFVCLCEIDDITRSQEKGVRPFLHIKRAQGRAELNK